MTQLLTVDLGGTKSRVGCFELKGKPQKARLAFQRVYKNCDFSAFEHVIEQFYKDFQVKAEYGCIAVAGVVEGNFCRMTNLSWNVEAKLLERRFSLRKIFLINDMTALAASIPLLEKEDIYTIQQGQPDEEGACAIIAPGTGLGQGYLHIRGDCFIVDGSEGGHVGFAPCVSPGSKEPALLSWLAAKQKYVSVEDVCAGPSIGTLFDFLVDTGPQAPESWVLAELDGAKDRVPVIVKGAVTQDKRCEVCQETLDLYLRILGAESGNLALKIFAKGGVYIGGGVIGHLFGKISFSSFLEAFQEKGKMSFLMKDIPVYSILREDAALWGILNYVLQVEKVSQ